MTEPKTDRVTLVDRVADHARWISDVRDPATANAEPLHQVRHGRAVAEWAVAPIPTGWAWHASGAVGLSSYGTPWIGPVLTRQDAEAAALASLLGWFRCGDKAVDPGAVRPMINDLTDRLGQEALF
jgi:hypothetical protein